MIFQVSLWLFHEFDMAKGFSLVRNVNRLKVLINVENNFNFIKAPREIDLPQNIFNSFSVPPALIAELRYSRAAYREQKQFSALPLSLSVTRLPKLNLTDAEALSYALILLIIICYAAEEGGQIEKAPECYALIAALRKRGESKTWNVLWCGSFNNPVLSFPDISTEFEKAENGLEASSETVSICQRTTFLPWINNSWIWNLFFPVFAFTWEKNGLLLILGCIIHCHPPQHLFSSISDVFLMNSECLISSLLSFTVGKRFPPGPAPYLEWLWMGSEQSRNQHPYWSVGKVEKGKHWLGGESEPRSSTVSSSSSLHWGWR